MSFSVRNSYSRVVVALSLTAVLLLSATTAIDARLLLVPLSYPTIGNALEASVAGDTIRVACGTYNERGLAMRSGVVLESETRDAACVVIDAGGVGRVMLCDAVDGNTRIEGLTLRGGAMPGGYGPFSWGAGMLCREGAEPTIVRCNFEDNVSGFGYGGAMGFENASPTLIECIFRHNRVLGDSVGNYGVGGALACIWSEAVLEACVFLENEAHDDGGAIHAQASPLVIRSCRFDGNIGGRDAGGIILHASDATITRCEFIGNQSGRDGGGIDTRTDSVPFISECVFRNNRASRGGGIASRGVTGPVVTDCLFEANYAVGGGGYGCTGIGAPMFLRSLFVGNSAEQHGGAVKCNDYAAPTFSQCTFVANTAGLSGAAGSLDISSPTFDHCIFAFHPAPSLFYCNTWEARFRCCDIFGNEGGDWVDWCIADQAELYGNFRADPLFCDVEGDDYRLSAGSPCLPEAGPGSCDLVGAFGQGCGTTAAVRTSWGMIKDRLRAPK